ncbi:MAG: helix-turn-helix domain-containing protein [Alphaproteobacteria bacterium]|nr:helix-turn-helix domain-containing protein [Alphaproteobacteria bacterium]
MELLTTQQASEFLGIPAQTLVNWRFNQRYPLPFVKIGKLVRYRKSDLVEFISQHLVCMPV